VENAPDRSVPYNNLEKLALEFLATTQPVPVVVDDGAVSDSEPKALTATSFR
jgi:hypothetical protein